MEDLFKLIREDAKDLVRRFEVASTEGRGTPQEIAEFREHALQDFLAAYYPFPYRIAKGGISDPNGRKSASVDCVLIHPDHPYTINRHEKFRLILADGVDAAIEVKPDISQSGELRRALEQGLTVKALRRAETSLLGNPEPQREAYRKRVPFLIFSMKAKKNILDTADEVMAFYAEKSVVPLDQADAIVVNGKGILANVPINGLGSTLLDPESEEDNLGWYYEEWGEDALAGLLLKLDLTDPARSPIQSPILGSYLWSAVERIQLYKLSDDAEPEQLDQSDV